VRFKIRLEFKLEDLWVGVYWHTDQAQLYTDSATYIRGDAPLGWIHVVDVWVCIIPCLPVHISWGRVHHHARVG